MYSAMIYCLQILSERVVKFVFVRHHSPSQTFIAVGDALLRSTNISKLQSGAPDLLCIPASR
jgi:hypothetical protein